MPMLTNGTPPQPYGEGGRYVDLPQEASTQLWEGGMVSAMATDGGMVPATTAGSGHVLGLATFDQLSTGSSNSRMTIWTDKVFVFAAGVNAPSDSTPYGTVLFAETDNTVGTGSGSETTIAGRFYGFTDDGRVRVFVSSQASWNDANADTNDGGTSAFKARAVVTTLQAYGGSTTGVLTESANGAISAADGVTLAVGDVVFVQEGTTNLTAASDAGPYVVTSLGGAGSKWVLTRPAWWQTGALITPGQTIEIGGEGTLWAGTQWKTFVAKTQIVDTNAPLFWVREVTQSITLVAGTATISNVGVRSASKTGVVLTRTATGGTVTSTVQYCPTAAGVSGLTAGAIGTGSVVVQATVAAGTIANADTSTLAATIINW